MKHQSLWLCLTWPALSFSAVAGPCGEGWCLECTDPSSGAKEQVVAEAETNFRNACLRVKTYPLFGDKWKTCGDADKPELRCVDEVGPSSANDG
jgi:hypothetical protein